MFGGKDCRTTFGLTGGETSMRHVPSIALALPIPVEYHCFEGTIHAFMSFAAAVPMGPEGLSFVASRPRSALRS
jgi:hypothetical protein